LIGHALYRRVRCAIFNRGSGDQRDGRWPDARVSAADPEPSRDRSLCESLLVRLAGVPSSYPTLDTTNRIDRNAMIMKQFTLSCSRWRAAAVMITRRPSGSGRHVSADRPTLEFLATAGSEGNRRQTSAYDPSPPPLSPCGACSVRIGMGRGRAELRRGLNCTLAAHSPIIQLTLHVASRGYILRETPISKSTACAVRSRCSPQTGCRWVRRPNLPGCQWSSFKCIWEPAIWGRTTMRMKRGKTGKRCHRHQSA
jgi:hypothetical protein